MQQLLSFYHPETPAFLRPFLALPALRRLEDVGMNCGCEYTSFPRFRDLPVCSRYRHSVGAALIVWHFTGDTAASLAALFHDISTPVFAHVVDFLRGDYLRQEATEDGTERLLRADPEIARLLGDLGLTIDDVKDYHIYPIADNDTPRLSADRLEYTLGNLLAYGFCDHAALRAFYGDLTVVAAGDGQPELAFETPETALDFARAAMHTARIYVAPEDRYAMQTLSELLREALRLGVLRPEDLETTESAVIEKLCADARTRALWERYRALHEMVSAENEAPVSGRRVIRAKKRWIDPLILGRGRVTEADAAFRAEVEAFLAAPQDGWLYAR